MTKVLITGATGNVGLEVIESLHALPTNLQIIAGVRNPGKDNTKFRGENVQCTYFDFTDPASFKPALANVDILFLLRPPQLSAVDKYFRPLVEAAIECKTRHIIFLSVQGVENSTIIPHYKIEKLIVESKIPYTFLRPGYFMQNFTTTLHDDLVKRSMIYLPAGDAKFMLIDVRDIGAVAADIIINIHQHINKAYEITSKDLLSFGEMAEKLSSHLGKNIIYRSPNPVQFFLHKKKEQMPAMFILVMLMLHYLPRYQKQPQVTDVVEEITGKQPISFDQFISDNKQLLA